MEKERTDFVVEMFSKYPPQPFSYDADLKSFKVGEQHVALEDYSEFVPALTTPISENAALALIEESTLLLNNFDTHYQMPHMYEWLMTRSNKVWDEASKAVVEIMMDAYVDVSGVKKSVLQKGTFMGFGLGLTRPGHPVFNVIGNCACYGSSPYGSLFDEDCWSDGFSEYELHNIDGRAQLVALHAGAGALAAMVES